MLASPGAPPTPLLLNPVSANGRSCFRHCPGHTLLSGRASPGSDPRGGACRYPLPSAPVPEQRLCRRTRRPSVLLGRHAPLRRLGQSWRAGCCRIARRSAVGNVVAGGAEGVVRNGDPDRSLRAVRTCSSDLDDSAGLARFSTDVGRPERDDAASC